MNIITKGMGARQSLVSRGFGISEFLEKLIVEILNLKSKIMLVLDLVA